MVHKALGCLADEDGSNYSKARIAMLIVGIVLLGFFIWLIVLSVAINKTDHSEHKVENVTTSTSRIPTSTSKISTSTKDNPKEKGWFLGKPLETCDSVCKRQNLICSENEFAIHSNEQDSTDLLLDLISELGGKTSDVICDQACAKDVPNFTEKQCIYSRCRNEFKFNCSAIPLPKDAKKQRLCYCNKEHDVSCKVTFIGGCKDHDKLRIKILRDHPYSVKECFEWCYDTKKCAGFFINNENKSCHLYKNGCTKALGKKFTYYSMNDCTES